MNFDIGPIVEGWEFDPNDICARKITGVDGRPKLQVRLDLGLLQMEMEGRPDGQRPFGRESLLEHYQEERDTYRSENGSDTGFQLDHEACGLLGQEGLQYYHRYVCLFRLEAYEEVERDTARNLRLFDFVHQYAADEEDRTSMEQYRPYVIMMNTRAKGALHVNRKDYDAALRQIEAGVERIRSFLQETGQVEEIETSNEIGFLRQWEEEVRKSRPLTLKQRLQQQLQEAIAREEFERAAEIRDQVRKLEQHNL
jgi:tetratricopeptide (TPR) repeat protein